jgi:transcriptional regulator with GAF, ATPase, and Fis domain
VGQRLGRYELIAGGTLFLDEVGELPLEIQAILLRVSTAVSSSDWGATPIRTDVRLIAATHRNVEQMVNVWRVALLGQAQVWPAQASEARVRSELPYHEARAAWLEHFEHVYLQRALDEAGGNVAQAARRTGLSREHFSKTKKKLGLE